MKSTRLLIPLAAMLIVAIGGIAGWYILFHTAQQPPPEIVANSSDRPVSPDPRETFATPFRNVRPGVKYTGDAACATCHVEIDHSYHQHPMGRSAALVSHTSTIEKFDTTSNNPVASQGYDLRVEKDDSGFRHVMSIQGSQKVPAYATTPLLAIGSGARGRSYVSVESEAAWQSPISWFSQTGGKWDVSPGFQLPEGTRREIEAKCLFCHVNQVDPVPQSINRYREPLISGQAAIGCERCHGPGELHVTERSNGVAFAGPDHTIVNPHHLPADLKMAICQQCHLQGVSSVLRPDRTWFDFRPGIPLEQFFTVFVRQPDQADYQHSVGQFEQMVASKCFSASQRGSQGKMECTTCHDPHFKAKPEDAAQFYRTKCLTCHNTKGCTTAESERLAKNNNCIQCHMTKAQSSNIAHTAVTDHTIQRNPTAPRKATDRPSRPPEYPIIPFSIGTQSLSVSERNRDLAIALSGIVRDPPPRMKLNTPLLRAQAEKLLVAGIQQTPQDPELLHQLAMLKSKFGGTRRADRQDAVKTLSAALAISPNSELYLARMADLSASANDYDTTIAVTTRLIELNPSSSRPRLSRAFCLMQKLDWSAAEADCREAIAIQPIDTNAWDLLAKCRQMQGDRIGMQAALDTSSAIKFRTK